MTAEAVLRTLAALLPGRRLPMNDAVNEPVSLALQLLDRPADWPLAAAALYGEAVCWRAPARGLRVEGREAVLAQLHDDARRFADAEQVVLRRVVAGDRLIDESVLSFLCPAERIAGVPAAAGDRIELKRTRLLRFAGGFIVDELNLETWTVLQRAG